MPEQRKCAVHLLAALGELQYDVLGLLGRQVPVVPKGSVHDDERDFEDVEFTIPLDVKRPKRVARAAAKAFMVRVGHGGVVEHAGLLPAAPGNRCAKAQEVLPAAISFAVHHAVERSFFLLEAVGLVEGVIAGVKADFMASVAQSVDAASDCGRCRVVTGIEITATGAHEIEGTREPVTFGESCQFRDRLDKWISIVAATACHIGPGGIDGCRETAPLDDVPSQCTYSLPGAGESLHLVDVVTEPNGEAAGLGCPLRHESLQPRLKDESVFVDDGAIEEALPVCYTCGRRKAVVLVANGYDSLFPP